MSCLIRRQWKLQLAHLWSGVHSALRWCLYHMLTGDELHKVSTNVWAMAATLGSTMERNIFCPEMAPISFVACRSFIQ